MSLSRFPWLGSNVRTAESFPGVIPNQIWEMKLGGFSLSSIGLFSNGYGNNGFFGENYGHAWLCLAGKVCVCVYVRVLFRFLIDI